MLKDKIYTGITVDDDALKVAKIKLSGTKITLLSLDKVRLVEPLKRKKKEAITEDEDDIFGGIDDDLGGDEVFGLDDDNESNEESELDFENLNDDLEDLEGFDIEDPESADEIIDTDMVDESETPASNELLIYNLLSSVSTERVDLGLTIPAGDTIFQILKDNDFSKTKKKDLQVIINDRLESFNGGGHDDDFYSYNVREDGSLLLTSIDEEPKLLTILNRTTEIYRGKLFINEILPDEVILSGLIKSNYQLDEDSITGVIQFGELSTRVFFMKGDKLWIISPLISEGVKDPRFLNTIFSKILFQLDTGEIPNLDQLIICNNSLGEEALDFFEERFQDLEVSEFTFSEEMFEAPNVKPSSISAFTTSIGAAWSASGFKNENFPKVSFLPKYVIDRQKIFKLQWHGFLLLFCILLTPIIANHFYTQNATEINRLQSDISLMDSQITALEPTVQSYNEISNELGQIQTKLTLLNELNQGVLRWSTNLGHLNEGVEDLGTIWFTSMNQDGNGSISINGYSTERNAIPRLANEFHSATLLNVSEEVIRERDVFAFRYVINTLFVDESIYNPEGMQGIQELIQD
jgi:Tfp pilus assembly protein PilN